MIRTGKLTAIVSLAAILACSSLAGTEPNDLNTPLTFEISRTELSAPGVLVRLRMGSSPLKVTVAYAAGIPYQGDVGFPPARSEAMDRFKSLALRERISEEQRHFLDAMDIRIGNLRDESTYIPPEDPNSRQILLYAVSLEDAKKMAKAFVQYAQDHFHQQVADHQAYIKETAEKVARMQQRLSELTQSEEPTRKALEEAEKQVPYRSVQQALDAAGELDKMLNTAHVEIAGIQATLKAIQDRTKPPASANMAQDLKERLETMFMEQSISLQAAEARKRMATELRKQADTYIDLTEALPRLTGEKELLTGRLADESRNLSAMQDDHSRLLESEPKTTDNKVFLYPIKR